MLKNALQLIVESRQNLSEYFHEQVEHAAIKLNVQLEKHAEYYLVNLLTDFRHTEQLFKTMDDTLEDAPLAILLERAVHGETQSTKIRMLKTLGDRALFVVGCFPQRADRHANTEYYMTMGSGAYQSLASMFQSKDAFADIFVELGAKFSDCVEVISEARRAGQGKTNEDLLHFYERWLNTGCERTAKILQREGIPLTQPNKTPQ